MKDGGKDTHTHTIQRVEGWSREGIKRKDLIHTNNFLLTFEDLQVNCRLDKKLTF